MDVSTLVWSFGFGLLLAGESYLMSKLIVACKKNTSQIIISIYLNHIFFYFASNKPELLVSFKINLIDSFFFFCNNGSFIPLELGCLFMRFLLSSNISWRLWSLCTNHYFRWLNVDANPSSTPYNFTFKPLSLSFIHTYLVSTPLPLQTLFHLRLTPL